MYDVCVFVFRCIQMNTEALSAYLFSGILLSNSLPVVLECPHSPSFVPFLTLRNAIIIPGLTVIKVRQPLKCLFHPLIAYRLVPRIYIIQLRQDNQSRYYVLTYSCTG